MEDCKLTQVPCREAILEIVKANKNRTSLQHIYSIAKLFQRANSGQAELSEEDWERYILLIKLFMIEDLEVLQMINSFARGLMR